MRIVLKDFSKLFSNQTEDNLETDDEKWWSKHKTGNIQEVGKDKRPKYNGSSCPMFEKGMVCIGLVKE